MNVKFLLSFFAIVALASCSRPQVSGVNESVKPPVREDIEWLDVWLPNTNDQGLPRVLLIGNSITRAYYPGVESRLKGKAYVGRLSTSKSLGDPALLAEVTLVLGYGTFDVVHFNNGLHGWGYTEDEYGTAFPELVKTIKEHAPGARLIWATTTPVRTGDGMTGFAPQTERVRARNRIASEIINGQDILVNDLFGLVEKQPGYYDGGDGTHLVGAGVEAMAEQVAAVISGVINTIKE